VGGLSLHEQQVHHFAGELWQQLISPTTPSLYLPLGKPAAAAHSFLLICQDQLREPPQLDDSVPNTRVAFPFIVTACPQP